MSCACFGLCVPLPFMPSYVWAKWRQPITTNLSYQLITSLSLLMLLTMLFPSRSHSCITSTATTSPLFSVIIQRQSSFCPVQFMLDYLKLRGNSRDLLFTIGGLPVHRQYFFAACLPLLLSVAVLTRHATKVIVFESELPLMRLRGECLTRRFVF